MIDYIHVIMRMIHEPAKRVKVPTGIGISYFLSENKIVKTTFPLMFEVLYS